MTAPRMVLGGLLLVFAFTALYVTAFHAPRPSGYELGVIGTPAQANRIEAELNRSGPGDFAVRPFGAEPEARAALLDTEVHAVVIPGAARDRALVAQALGAAPTETVIEALQLVDAQAGTPVAVQDLRPLPANDGRGLSPLFTVVGTLIPSLMLGALLSVFGRGLPARVRWAGVVGYSLLAGIVVAFNVDVLVGALQGHFIGIAVVTALLALAAAATAHGLGHLGGQRGIVVAVLVLLLVGLSSSGGAVGYQFEPGFYAAVSQLLPPGAAVTAIRNVQYFDWAATAAPLLVLGAWACGGIVLGLLGERFGPHVRGRRLAVA
jgi:hypothetical protein